MHIATIKPCEQAPSFRMTNFPYCIVNCVLLMYETCTLSILHVYLLQMNRLIYDIHVRSTTQPWISVMCNAWWRLGRAQSNRWMDNRPNIHQEAPKMAAVQRLHVLSPSWKGTRTNHGGPCHQGSCPKAQTAQTPQHLQEALYWATPPIQSQLRPTEEGVGIISSPQRGDWSEEENHNFGSSAPAAELGGGDTTSQSSEHRGGGISP